MSRATSAKPVRRSARGAVVPLPSVASDQALLEGLQSGEAWARAALFDRYAPEVERILRRILGKDCHTEMADVCHDAFVQALQSIDRLRSAEALTAWMHSIAAHTAFRTIRSRRARRWLRFWEPEEVPEICVDGVDPELVEAYRRTYAILDRFAARERVVFALRHIEGMEIARVAEACDVSLATAKRRLARAEQRFARAAGRDEVLRPWLEEGGRWAT